MPTKSTDSTESPHTDALPGDGLVDLATLPESEWRALVARSFANGAARMDATDRLIGDNTALTAAVWQGTAEIREIVLMGRTFFATMGKIARGCGHVWAVLRPIVTAGTVIAGAYMAIRGAIWTAAHGGQPPPTK